MRMSETSALFERQFGDSAAARRAEMSSRGVCYAESSAAADGPLMVFGFVHRLSWGTAGSLLRDVLHV